MKKLIFYLILLIGSIFIYSNLEPTENIDINVKEYDTFPPKEYQKYLKDKEIQ